MAADDELLRIFQKTENKEGPATEKTLAELRDVMSKLGGSSGELKKEKDASEDLTKAKKKEKEVTEELTDSIDDTKDSFSEAARELRNMGYAINGIVRSGTGLITNLANVGNSVSSAANTLDDIPIVGTVLSTVFGAVASAAERVAETFIKATAGGASFGGSVLELARNAGMAGMTLDQFGDLVRSNGDGLLGLANNTEAGARRFSLLSRRIINTSDDLFALGFSTQDLNESLARYSAQQRFLGRQELLTDQQLIAGTRQYAKDLDVLAKITGEERKTKEQERDALMKDVQFRLGLAGKNQDVVRSFTNLVQAMPSGPLQDFVKDVISSGTITSDEFAGMASQMGGSFTMLQELFMKRSRNIALSDDEINEMLNMLSREGNAASMMLGAAGQAANEQRGMFQGVTDAASIVIDGFKDSRSSQDSAIQSSDQFNSALQEAQRQVAQLGNFFSIALAQSGMLPFLLDSFALLGNITANVIMPVFRGFGNILGEYIIPTLTALAPALIGLGVGIATFTAVMKGYELVTKSATAITALFNTIRLAGATIMGIFTGSVTAANIALLPIAAIGAVIVGALGLLSSAFILLYSKGWTLGMMFENFGLNISKIGLVMSDFMNFLQNQIPNALGGISDAEYERRRAINDDARKQIEERKIALQQQRAENAEKRAFSNLFQNMIPNFDDLTELQKLDIDQKKELMGLNYSGDPVALLKGFAEQEGSAFVSENNTTQSATATTTTKSTTRPTSVGAPRTATSQQLDATMQALNSLEALPTQERQKVQTQIDALRKQKDELTEQLKNNNDSGTNVNPQTGGTVSPTPVSSTTSQNMSSTNTDQLNTLIAELTRYMRETSINTKRTAEGVGSMSGDLYSNIG